MDAMLKTKIVKKMARILDDHNAEDVKVLDVSKICSWTDFFVISTVNSYGHLKGLLKHLKELANSEGINLVNAEKKAANESWLLLDGSFFVVHLMTKEMRDFYDLEKLWFHGTDIDYSSKSSYSSPSS